jgi:hypothetical protein
MKNKKYCTVGTIPTSTIKAVERGNIDTPHTHKYMTAHFPGLIQALQ